MTISIITVSYNSASTIRDSIESVLGQSYSDIEYIVIDGGSTDGTIDIVKSYGARVAKFISEPDAGIYDAMNKGIKWASGEIVGILNSDDVYANDHVLETVVRTLESSQADCCYGDLVYVNKHNTRIVRRWKSCDYRGGLFEKGWVPAHPTFFVKRWAYEKYGTFDLSLPLVADHEILFRFMHRYKIKSYYIPQILVRMRLGGITNRNLFSVFKQNFSIIETLRKNQIKVPTLPFLVYKFFDRVKQFF